MARTSQFVRTAMDVPRTAPKRPNRAKYLWGAGSLAFILGVTVVLGRMGNAAPTVERQSVWIETVKRGEMLRSVQGQGTLIPEEIRWITARSAAHVEQILVRPGAQVKADTVLVVLSNPDVELHALEAERERAAAESDLANLKATTQRERLAQQSSVASLQSELGDARRRAEADSDLAKRGFLSDLQLGESTSRAENLGNRLDFEKKRLTALADGEAAQLEAARANVERLKAIAEFRAREVDALKVKAGIDGVLQELPLQVGQSVAVGAELAKVARPDKLMAEVRVPETLARELRIGLTANVDTHDGSNGVVEGKVARVDPAVQGGTVLVDVTFAANALPSSARPDQSVIAEVELERIPNALYVGRPTTGEPNATVSLWKLIPSGDEAVRVPVKLGRASVKTVEIVEGLAEGDRVILSDLAQYDRADRIRLR